MHSLLEKQLRRLGIGEDMIPTQSAWSQFIAIVDRTYVENDKDRYGKEHSLDVYSAEMTTRYEDLKEQSENQLTQERDKLQTVIDAVPATVSWITQDLKYLGVNRLMSQYFGVLADTFVGKEVGFIDASLEGRAQLKALFDSTQYQKSWELQDSRDKRKKRAYLVSARKYQDGQAAVIIGRDITTRKYAEEWLKYSNDELELRVKERTAELERQLRELKRTEDTLASTEEQLRQSQKLEAIGRLAGGVAHDFNNILTVILGHLELILQEFDGGDTLREDLLIIQKAGCRGADLTRQLLAFSRRQILKPKVIDLNEILSDLQSMLPRLLGEHIELLIRINADACKIKADPTQIDQVIMNLVVNARDAMPTGGKVTIEIFCVEVDQEFADRHMGARPGRYSGIAISDTGVGMDKDTLGRIFEPFFTTKEKGKGTGLGLSTSLGIIQQSSGWISVDSKVNHGTVFKVYFPCTNEATSSLSHVKNEVPEKSGSETILVVEDEEDLRSLIFKILTARGYQVLTAQDPSEAIGLVSSHTGRIHLLITDVVMPKMDGRTLSDLLRSSRPDLRVIFMSGYTDDAIVHHGVLEENVTFLAKPFTTKILTDMVRESLDQPIPAPSSAPTKK